MKNILNEIVKVKLKISKNIKILLKKKILKIKYLHIKIILILKKN